MTHRESAHEMTLDPIVIFSMGKTGTSSLSRALREATGRPVVKAHALSPDGIARRLAKAERLGINDRPRQLWRAEEISRSLATGDSWKLLCGVRDPIAAAVSDHFYGLSRQEETGVTPWMTGEIDAHAQAIAANIEENFVTRDWFRDELLPATGIDVYATSFPTGAGAATLRNGQYCALILRAEDLSEVGPTAVADFLDLDAPLPLAHRNRAVSTTLSPYDRFREAGRLPAEIVSAAYETRLARHFYSPTERAHFHARWTGGHR